MIFWLAAHAVPPDVVRRACCLWRRCLAFTLEMPFKDTEDRPDPEQVLMLFTMMFTCSMPAVVPRHVLRFVAQSCASKTHIYGCISVCVQTG